jgi:hypothetical protein
MSGAIPPLPQYAFMVWCLVKAQGQLYLYLFLRQFCILFVHFFSVCIQLLQQFVVIQIQHPPHGG